MKIFKDTETFGVPTWICLHDCYMYTGETFLTLITQMIKDWNKDKHLVG